MNNMSLAEAYLCLDLAPGASPLEVERAFRRKKALYAESTLATYALLDAEARLEKLTRLETAYRRIREDRTRESAPPSPSADWGASAPDPAVSPGLFLKSRRESSGLTVGEVANRTKISPMKLIQVEEEKYERLPAPVYLRGFILSYARALGLPDPKQIAHFYLLRYRERVGDP